MPKLVGSTFRVSANTICSVRTLDLLSMSFSCRVVSKSGVRAYWDKFCGNLINSFLWRKESWFLHLDSQRCSSFQAVSPLPLQWMTGSGLSPNEHVSCFANGVTKIKATSEKVSQKCAQLKAQDFTYKAVTCRITIVTGVFTKMDCQWSLA